MVSLETTATDKRDGARRRVPHRTLLLIRWIAIAGQLASLLLVHFYLRYPLPLAPALATIGASVLLNFFLMLRHPRRGQLGDGEAAIYLGFDIVQLAALLSFTGGLTNPFALLILVPVMVAATVMPRRLIVGLSLLAVACATMIAFWHLPLPWPDAGLILPRVYILGIWTAMVFSTVFIAAYAGSITLAGQRMQDALDETQHALAREHRHAAVGTLAAAAAHELGSPLSTIAVMVKEMTRVPEVVDALGEDIEILESEINRCREILLEMGRSTSFDAADPYSVMPLTALVEAAVAQNENPARTTRVSGTPDDGSPEPHVARSPEFLHGLGNIVQNAGQFANQQVDVEVVWTHETVMITVRDDGHGFPASLLDRIGEPYISTRAQSGEHMGLGLFIAQTLLERTGAALKFDNHLAGGARVEMVWPRARLEYMKD